MDGQKARSPHAADLYGTMTTHKGYGVPLDDRAVFYALGGLMARLEGFGERTATAVIAAVCGTDITLSVNAIGSGYTSTASATATGLAGTSTAFSVTKGS
jgi:hypothetical protein